MHRWLGPQRWQDHDMTSTAVIKAKAIRVYIPKPMKPLLETAIDQHDHDMDTPYDTRYTYRVHIPSIVRSS